MKKRAKKNPYQRKFQESLVGYIERVLTDDDRFRGLSLDDIDQRYTVAKLLSQYLTDRKENPSAPNYKEAHWGNAGKERETSLKVCDPKKARLVKMGELVQCVYRTMKGKDRKPAEYEHDFEGPLPWLCYDQDTGLLVVAGGGYKVTVHGIVG